MSEYRLYLTTVQNKKDAKKIAEALLKYKAAACINIIEKMTSIYMWNNKICSDEECLLVIKSKAELFEKLQKIILTLHKYDLPEIIEIPIIGGHNEYLNWIDESTAQ